MAAENAYTVGLIILAIVLIAVPILIAVSKRFSRRRLDDSGAEGSLHMLTKPDSANSSDDASERIRDLHNPNGVEREMEKDRRRVI